MSEPENQTYVERMPPAVLADVVASMWVQRIPRDGDAYVQRHLPSGSVELRCRVGDVPRVGGPLTRAEVEVLVPGSTVVGLRFWPAAGSRVLPLPVSDLADEVVAADALWGAAGVALGESVAAASTAGEGLRRLVGHVARMLDAVPADPLVSAAVDLLHWRTEDVGRLTGTLHVSERHLRRRVQAVVGLPPKALHRTLRFQDFLALAQHAIAQGRAPTQEGLARLAAEAGYADQAHLNRECARLTGMTPGALLGRAAHTCACGHDHAAAFVPLLRSRPRSSTR